MAAPLLRPGGPLGVTSIGDWTFIFDPDWLGTREDVITKLSEGTRLVSQAALGIKDMDYFYWCEDGEIRFAWGGDDGYSMETPDELVDTMAQIDRLYPSFPRLYKGLAFLLVEHLTGIRATEQLLKSFTLMWGVAQNQPSRNVDQPGRLYTSRMPDSVTRIPVEEYCGTD